MARFDAARQDAPTAVKVHDQVMNLCIVPQAYLLCANSAQGPRIYCAHSPSKYRSALGADVNLAHWCTAILISGLVLLAK